MSRYERAVRALAEVAPNESEAVLDTQWVDRTQKLVKAETDRLEHELRGYKNNLIKESIRVCPSGFHPNRNRHLCAGVNAFDSNFCRWEMRT